LAVPVVGYGRNCLEHTDDSALVLVSQQLQILSDPSHFLELTDEILESRAESVEIDRRHVFSAQSCSGIGQE
jgi:hypothetical protein